MNCLMAYDEIPASLERPWMDIIWKNFEQLEMWEVPSDLNFKQKLEPHAHRIARLMESVAQYCRELLAEEYEVSFDNPRRLSFSFNRLLTFLFLIGRHPLRS